MERDVTGQRQASRTHRSPETGMQVDPQQLWERYRDAIVLDGKFETGDIAFMAPRTRSSLPPHVFAAARLRQALFDSASGPVHAAYRPDFLAVVRPSPPLE